MIDDDGPVTDLFDIAEIMRSEKDGCFFFLIDFVDNASQFLFGNNIQSDCGFV